MRKSSKRERDELTLKAVAEGRLLRGYEARPTRRGKELMAELERKLTREFFESLKDADPDLHRKDPHKVKQFEFEGKLYVIKDTLGRGNLQGYNYEDYRRALHVHQLAVRNGIIKPKHYMLRTIRVHGRIGNYLVMDFVDGRKYSTLVNSLESPQFLKKTRDELEENLEKLNKKGFTTMVRGRRFQFDHSIVRKARFDVWEFYLPYDTF